MTCGEFEEVVHGFVRMELLDVAVREAALEHVANCSECADRMGEATLLADATNAAAKRSRALETPARVEAALVAAFRKEHQGRSRRRSFEWLSAGAIAATILIAVWTFAGHSKGQPGAAPKPDVSSKSNRPVEAMAPNPGSGTEVSDESSSAAEAGAGAAFAAADFVPVPYTDGIGQGDVGTVLRVQLSRASLAELGYPVDDLHATDWVRADVLVGQDGWPRGVKLVQ